MSQLELFSKLKRRTNSLLTEPAQGPQKHTILESKFSPLPHSRLQQVNQESYSKILPKNMLYDKESLYLEVLTLKVELNQLMNDNIRLKTKNITLEKELDVLGRKSADERNSAIRSRKGKNEGARLNENPFVDGLKQMLKETKKQAQVLRNQNIKMKKSVKLSKINELEVQNSIILEQNRRLSQLNEELQQRIAQVRSIEDKNQQLERNRLSLIGDIKRLEQEITTLQSYIQAIQLEHKYNFPSKNRLWEPSIQRRGNAGMKNLEQLRKQFLNSRETSFRINKKDPKSKLNQQGLMFRKEPIVTTQTQIMEQPKEYPKQLEQLQEQNKKLKKDKEILETAIKNLQVKHQLSQIQVKPKQHIDNSKEDKEEKEEKQWEQGEKSEQIKLEYTSVQGFLQSGATPPKLVQQPSKAFSEPEVQLGERSVFKSNRRIIDEICDLLSSRMRAQRYTFAELQVDIEKSSAKDFTYVDLCHMFVNEPFYLTVDYCRALIGFILEKDKPSHLDQVASMTLIAKLRRVIKDFAITSQEDQHNMVQHCADVITKESKQVRDMCERAKGAEGKISAPKLAQVLQGIGLNKAQIDMIIGEIAICSPSLYNLDMEVLFQRFDLSDLSIHQSNIIEQQENDDSFIHLSKHKEEVTKKESSELLGSKKTRGKSKIEQQINI